jgi:hypothetical protein
MIDSVRKWKTKEQLTQNINGNPHMVWVKGILWDKGENLGVYDSSINNIPYGKSVVVVHDGTMFRFKQNANGVWEVE